jgi:hypothetical protein
MLFVRRRPFIRAKSPGDELNEFHQQEDKNNRAKTRPEPTKTSQFIMENLNKYKILPETTSNLPKNP